MINITVKRQNCTALLILVAPFEINFLLVWAFFATPKGRHSCFIRILMRRVLMVPFAAYYSNCYNEEFYILVWEYWKESNSVSQFWWHFISPELKIIYMYVCVCVCVCVCVYIYIYIYIYIYMNFGVFSKIYNSIIGSRF